LVIKPNLAAAPFTDCPWESSKVKDTPMINKFCWRLAANAVEGLVLISLIAGATILGALWLAVQTSGLFQKIVLFLP